MKFHIIFTLIASFVMVSCKPIDEENILLDYALSPDGATLAIYSNTGIDFYDLATMNKSNFMEFNSGDYSFLLSSGAITVSHDGEQTPFSMRSGAIAFSHDGKQIAVSGKFADEPIRIWDIDSQKQIATISNSLSEYYVTEIEFSPNGKSIIVRNTHTNSENCEGYVGDKIILHNVYENEELFEVDGCPIYPPVQFLFTKDEKIFLYFGTMSPKYEVYFIDSNTGKPVHKECKWDQNGGFYGSSTHAVTYLLDECIPDSPIHTMLGRIPLFLDQNNFVLRNHDMSRDADWEFWENNQIKCAYDDIKMDPSIKPSSNGKTFAFLTSYLVEQNIYQKELQAWDTSTCTKISSLEFN